MDHVDGAGPVIPFRGIGREMPNSAKSYAWVWVDASYLREQAQRCVHLARDCPHRPTALELEAIGMDLMLKASELDELQEGGGDEGQRKQDATKK